MKLWLLGCQWLGWRLHSCWTEQIPVWLSAGREECLQVSSGSGVQTEGAAAWAPGVGAGLDLVPGCFEWDRLATVQIGHIPSRVPGLPWLVFRQHAESSTQWMPGPAGDPSPALRALLLICGPFVSAVTSGRSGGARDLSKGSSPFPVRLFEARAFSVVIR